MEMVCGEEGFSRVFYFSDSCLFHRIWLSYSQIWIQTSRLCISLDLTVIGLGFKTLRCQIEAHSDWFRSGSKLQPRFKLISGRMA